MSQNHPPHLSIVIPAYNEERKIEQDITAVFEYFQDQSYPIEIIVVNDGSKDATLQKVQMLCAKYKDLRCVSYPNNRGKGYAVKTGVLKSKGNYLLFVDAGSCVPYNAIDQGFSILKNGVDIAIGSRALRNSNIIAKQQLYRRVGGRIFWLLIRFFLGVKELSDTQCGFKMFTKEAACRIFAEQQIDGFMFDIEWIIRAQKYGYKMKEFPLQWICDKDSRFRFFPGAFRVFYDLIRIKLKGR